MSERSPKPPSGHSVEVSRFFATTAELLFDAFTRPELLAAWWAPEDGIRTDVREMDVQVGGRYAIRMHLPGGVALDIDGTYMEVDRPWRLAFTWNAPCGDGRVSGTLVTITFTPNESGTRLTIVHAGLPSAPVAREHQNGWAQKLRYLERSSTL